MTTEWKVRSISYLQPIQLMAILLNFDKLRLSSERVTYNSRRATLYEKAFDFKMTLGRCTHDTHISHPSKSQPSCGNLWPLPSYKRLYFSTRRGKSPPHHCTLQDWVPGQYGISPEIQAYSYEIYLGIGFVKDSLEDRKIKGKKLLHTFLPHSGEFMQFHFFL